MIFADEASFRQDPTLYQTWSRRGCQPLIPTTGQRNTQKILGAVDLYRTGFYFGWGEVFDGQTYTGFLDGLRQCYPRREVFLVHDNAAYHWAPEVEDWLERYGHRFHLVALPRYSPEINAVERIWHYVRVVAAHNRYFPTKQEFVHTLHRALTDIQRYPDQIVGYMQPFP